MGGPMGWQFRKSKKFGLARFTLSQRGLSSSFGAGPFRLSFGADGRTRRTIRVPGTGLYNVKTISGGQRARRSSAKTGSGHPFFLLLLIGLAFYFLSGTWRTVLALAGIALVVYSLITAVRSRNAGRASPTPMALPPPQVEAQPRAQRDPEGMEAADPGFIDGLDRGFGKVQE